jgi:dGTPase
MDMDLNIRGQCEQLEIQNLSPYASLSGRSRGREKKDTVCPLRTCYQRDRDRILHSKSFRRLMHKTQVFLSPEGDHYRTRLTHTLEICQIARTISRSLRLNEDLTEAIALGHDLGHTPFGHAGEYVLDEICADTGGYRHAEQSVRVLEVLENSGLGLNLTWEVRNGIRCHSSGTPAETLEGRVVRYADKIGYMNHDIEDACRAGVLAEDDVPWEVRHGLGRDKSERITTLITSIIDNSTDDIRMSANHQQLYDRLREFMFAAVYTCPSAKGEEGKAKDVIRRLVEYFMKHTHELPEEYLRILEREGELRAVCDYISGMSDRYCIAVFENLFVPKSWSV